ncbi:Fis family transcriptional regulator [Betaproteobacteria bacterium]|nr:Fis family transcriptional regulator [Betaproteobacteria bacterium]GHU13836.1 Fis family transcriptional regulator [Betaproteobacteria bacterium]GHU48742.1 Fis family transcriptional regulator [Betaproteobacteria bacterium]
MSQHIQAGKCPIGEIRRYEDISLCIRDALEQYFRDLNGEKPNAIYDMVIKSVERPMLEIVLRQSQGNQTQAAEMLGINRNTLHKKLTEFQLI